jgi:YVTN family beta-propeller protein
MRVTVCKLVAASVLLVICTSWVHAAPFAYIANEFSDSVSVIETNSYQVVAEIPVGDAPYGVNVLPGGSRVYVTTGHTNPALTIIDGTTQTVRATHALPGCSTPRGVASDFWGFKLYIACRGSGQVRVLEWGASDLTIASVTDIPMGGQPYHMAFNFGNLVKKLYVTVDKFEAGPDAIVVLNSSDQIIDTIDIGAQCAPEGIAYDDSGESDFYYVACAGGVGTGTEGVYMLIDDFVNGGIIQQTPEFPAGMAVDPRSARFPFTTSTSPSPERPRAQGANCRVSPSIGAVTFGFRTAAPRDRPTSTTVTVPSGRPLTSGTIRFRSDSSSIATLIVSVCAVRPAPYPVTTTMLAPSTISVAAVAATAPHAAVSTEIPERKTATVTPLRAA